MKFISGLIALAALASAAPGKAPTPLDIKLESAGNAEIKAVITNTGKNNLKIFKTGTILDSSPVEKVKISSGGVFCLLLSYVFDLSCHLDLSSLLELLKLPSC